MVKKWYVVIVGQQVGVFQDWLEAGPLVGGVAGCQHKSYDTESDAKAAFQRALDSGYVRAIGSRTEPPQATTSAMVSPTRSSTALDYEPQTPTKKWYVVIVGRQVGVFRDWLQVAPLVYNVAGSQHKSYDTESEARAAYTRALANKYVRVVDPMTRPPQNVESTSSTPGPSITASKSPTDHSLSCAKPQAVGFEPDPRHPGLHPNVTVRGAPSPTNERTIPQRLARNVEDAAHTEGKDFIAQNMSVSKSPNCSGHIHTKRVAPETRKEQFPTMKPRPEGQMLSPIKPRLNGPEQMPSRSNTPPRTPSLARSSTRVVRSPAPSSSASCISSLRDYGRFSRRSSTKSCPSPVHSPTVTGRVNIIVADLSDVESYPSDSDESSGPEDVTPGRLLSPIGSPNLSNTQDLMLALNIDRMSVRSNGRPESASGTFTMQCTPREPVRRTCMPKRRQVKDVGVATSPPSPRACAKSGHENDGNTPSTKAGPSTRGKVKEEEDILGWMGMSQPTHVPSVVYDPGNDPRSPIRDVRTFIPERSHVSFGRPSPKILVDASTPSCALFSQ